ncbi:TniB family NTP-binding protein, partial [Paracraurococcus lichenis]
MTTFPSHTRVAYAAFARKYVAHPRLTTALEAVVDAMSYAGVEDEPPNIPITGPSGVGKTTLLKQLVALHPVVPDGCRIEVLGAPSLVADRRELLPFEFP